MNNGVIVLDLETVNKYRIVNLYRTFAPTNGLSQAQSFINQLCILENCSVNLQGRKLIIMGDFNLDDRFKHNIEYRNHKLFTELNETMDRIRLVQLVDFMTWQRVVENVQKESILDHLYTSDPEVITSTFRNHEAQTLNKMNDQNLLR